MTQIPGETYSLIEQQLMIDTVLDPMANVGINIPELKKSVKEISKDIKGEENYDTALVMLKEQALPKGAVK
jgi:hypothetical protein